MAEVAPVSPIAPSSETVGWSSEGGASRVPEGSGGHDGRERRGVQPTTKAGQPPRGPERRRRERSPLRTLRGTGRVVPFRRSKPAGSPQELAPRQSRFVVAALGVVLAGILVVTTAVLRPRAAPPGSEIVLAASQFPSQQPEHIDFAQYPHVTPALGHGMFVVRLATGWAAFADLPPDQVPTTGAAACTLLWSAQAGRFQDPCTGMSWQLDGTAVNPADSRQVGLTAFAVTAAGAFIDVNVGQVAP